MHIHYFLGAIAGEARAAEADARAAAEADAKLKKPVRDEPKAPRLKTEEDAGLAVAERRRALQAEAQRVADIKAAEQAERGAREPRWSKGMMRDARYERARGCEGCRHDRCTRPSAS